MRLKRFLGGASAVCVVTAAMTGTVMASSSIVVDSSGPGSSQVASADRSSSTSVTNTTVVRLSSTNVQLSDSGDSGSVAAANNTNGGQVFGSGDASNDSSSTSVVSIDNSVPAVAGETDVAVVGGQADNVGSIVSSATKPGSGSVLGASTAGIGAGVAALLPSVGALSPIDVSALRAAWRPQTDAPIASLVKPAQGITTGMLAGATLLGLLGAFGSVMRARRKSSSV